MEDANLADMARAFQTATTRLVVVDDALARQDKRASFRVQDLDPAISLELVCSMLEIAWYADRSTIHVTTKEAAEDWRKEHE